MKSSSTFFLITLFALGQLFTTVNAVFAVIANPEPISYTQPDGTKLTILLKGEKVLTQPIRVGRGNGEAPLPISSRCHRDHITSD